MTFETLTTSFDRDTAVSTVGDGRYEVELPSRWSNGRSLSGGFVAATIVRAMEAEVSDATRALRSITVHYLDVAETGSATIATTIERAGRGLTTITARLSELDRPIAIAMAAFATSYPGAAAYDDTQGVVPAAPDTLDPPPPGEISPPFLHNFRMKPTDGPPPFGGRGPAFTAGWIEPVEPRPLDAALVVALADAWWPSPFVYTEHRVPSPTIDLTVHVRAPLPRPAEKVFSEFRSTLLSDGMFEEDGRLRTADGVLLAQSRQLAFLLPRKPA
jgi:acyl-CoA thioesterase